ncbi:MAG: DUF3570 domain-containing protein [Myxococcales bacterium]|nr:DUF3570 domain-containing protein [Myxococcales bacterium]
MQLSRRRAAGARARARARGWRRVGLVVLVALLAPLARGASGHADDPWRLSLDGFAYSDTDNVQILAPQTAVRYALDSEGGEFGVRYMADIVSAASVDVLSHATTRFEEVRHEGAVWASKAFGDHLPSLAYRLSREPDYLSHDLRAGWQSRVGGADSTLSGGVGLTLDTITRSGTPPEAFEESLQTYSLELGLTQNLSSRALLRGVATFTLQRGYLEKPYRYVALFDAAGLDRAQAEGVALDLDTFDRYRLALRPPEQVPDSRARGALALRFMYSLESIGAALRLDYQLYLDDWGVLANTLAPSLRQKLGAGFRMDLGLRLYHQRAASFWRRVYVVRDVAEIPRLRSADRELSRYLTVSATLRLAWGSEGGSADPLEAYVEVGVMQSFFPDFLFLDQRTALTTLLGGRARL